MPQKFGDPIGRSQNGVYNIDKYYINITARIVKYVRRTNVSKGNLKLPTRMSKILLYSYFVL